MLAETLIEVETIEAEALENLLNATSDESKVQNIEHEEVEATIQEVDLNSDQEDSSGNIKLNPSGPTIE